MARNVLKSSKIDPGGFKRSEMFKSGQKAKTDQKNKNIMTNKIIQKCAVYKGLTFLALAM